MGNVANTVSVSQPDHAQRLLSVIRNLVREVHPESTAGLAVGLDSTLDRELGLDSLSRVELFARLEREFHADLPERLLSEAQTPADFLSALLEGAGGARPPSVLPDIEAGRETAAGIPDSVRTLAEALAWQAAHHGACAHIHLHTESETIQSISYGDLYREARAIAVGLRRSGLKPGQTVALMLPTGRDFFRAFTGIQLAGGIPVPIYPPTRLSQVEDHLLRQKGILTNAAVVTLLTVPEATAVARMLRAHVPAIRHVRTADELADDPDAFTDPRVTSLDTAFLQYTSGSTGNPKGVVLTHANLLANIRAMRSALQVTANDVFVSWLPLYHDMGFIGAWLGALCCGYPLAIMSPLAFLSKPARWLQAIHAHRGTISAAPNFAYELCATQIADKDIQGLDLSSWRLALNGAEPVSPDTLERFASRFASYGFRAEAMLPVYGLAESTVGVTFPPPGRGPRIDHIRADPFRSDGSAIPATADDPHVLRFVSCGRPLPGHDIRIADDQGHERPDRMEGHLLFKGPSVTSGYFRNPDETARMTRGEWLDSFDLAYRADGEVYITGRAKDLIIRGGRNLYPYELELAIGKLPGLRKGCVAAFGSRDPRTATERLIVVAETKQRDPAKRETLRLQINTLATALVGSPPDEIVLAPPHSVLKTSSGKIRRGAVRERFERGAIGLESSQSWRHLARPGLSGLLAQLRYHLRTLSERLYGLYAVGMFALLGASTWLAVALLPSGRAAYRVAHSAARTFFALCGFSIRVSGKENLQLEQAAIIVCNHSNYLDGILLCAVLPGRPHFTVKGELAQGWPMRLFLNKLGAFFVERFAVEKSLADARRLSDHLGMCAHLVFFPEGTFRRLPGLLPFRLGAFSAAVQSQAPVLPVVIRGTRAALPDGNWLPRPSRISVTICPPVMPTGGDFQAALALRNAARASILRHLDEPDIIEPTDTVLTVGPPRR